MARIKISAFGKIYKGSMVRGHKKTFSWLTSRKYVFMLASLVFLACTLNSCHNFNREVHLSYERDLDIDLVHVSTRLAFIQLKDRRASKETIGNVMDSIGIEFANVKAINDVSLFMSRAIASYLRKAGVDVIEVEKMEDAKRLANSILYGSVDIFFDDLTKYHDFYQAFCLMNAYKTFKHSAVIKITLNLEKIGKPKFERTYLWESTPPIVFQSADEYQFAFSEATSSLLRDAIPDLLDYLREK